MIPPVNVLRPSRVTLPVPPDPTSLVAPPQSPIDPVITTLAPNLILLAVVEVPDQMKGAALGRVRVLPDD